MSNAWDSITEEANDAHAMFDLAIFGAYIAGSHGRPVPVKEARKVFEKIIEIINEGDTK